MERLNLIEWNVKNMHDKPCRPYVADKLLESSGNPDVIFLCEYSYNANRKEFENKISEKYRIISKQNSGIMIAIKKEINCVPGPASTVEGQHFLAKKIIIDGKIIKLVGVRIQVVSGDWSEEEQKNRKKQLEKIISALKKDENVIIMGDFNNYRCLGDENDIKNYIKIYEKKEQKIYNLQSVKKLFFDNGYKYKKSTPMGDTYSYKLGYTTFKYDHIFVKGDLFVESANYDWEWEVEESKTKGYNPDHALLEATVEIKR